MGLMMQKSAEKIADQYSKLEKSERLTINKMYEYVVMEIDYIADTLKAWDSSIQVNNLKMSLIAQRKLLDKGYIPKLRYTIDDTLKKTYQEVLGYKNYLDFSRKDYALMGLAFISNLQGNNISGGNVGNTGGFQGSTINIIQCTFKIFRYSRYFLISYRYIKIRIISIFRPKRSLTN